MTNTISVWTEQADPSAAFQDLAAQAGDASPAAIVFFAPPDFDGTTLSRLLHDRYRCPAAGCTTAGEISDHSITQRGITALILNNDKVVRAAGTIASFSGNIGDQVRDGVQRLASELGLSVREADSSRFVGIVLIDGLSQNEEEVNYALGTAAPGLMFVGGSAGDDLRFQQTTLFLDGHSETSGALLLLLETAVPFSVTRSHSAEATEHRFRITRADERTRTVYEVDGQPVLPTYAKITGVKPEELSFEQFVRYPWALADQNEAWLRSPRRTTPDGGLEFFCSIREGMELTVMRQTPIIESTRQAFDRVAEGLGGKIGAGLIFNCVYRRLELDHSGLHKEYQQLYSSFPAVGLHTYGESLIAHMNQTCTALFLG